MAVQGGRQVLLPATLAEIHPAPFFEMLKNKMNMGLSGPGHRMGWPGHEAAADAGDSVSAV